MSEADNESLPPDWVEKTLAELRQQMASDEWAEAALQLLADLRLVASSPQDEVGDEDMLSIAVDDALKGIDVSQRYPQFFRQMLANPFLYESFVEALERLEEETPESREAFPFVPSRDLSFLEAFRTPQPTLEEDVHGRWQAIWRGTREYLQALLDAFMLPDTLVADYREAGIMESPALTLFESNIDVADVTLDVILDATQPADAPSELLLSLWAAESAQPGAVSPVQPIQATVSWGDYQETVTLSGYGTVAFPPVPLSAILAEDGESIGAELQLRLAPTK